MSGSGISWAMCKSAPMTSYFAPEVAKYNFGSVRVYCFTPLVMQLVVIIICCSVAVHLCTVKSNRPSPVPSVCLCIWKASDRLLERSNNYSVMEMNDDGTPVPTPPSTGYMTVTVVTNVIVAY